MFSRCLHFACFSVSRELTGFYLSDHFIIIIERTVMTSNYRLSLEAPLQGKEGDDTDVSLPL